MNRKAKVLVLSGLVLLLGAGAYLVPTLLSGPSKLPPGAEPLNARNVHFYNQSFDVVRIDPRKYELRLFWKNDAGEPYGDFESLRSELEAKGQYLRFATNAGIFSEDQTPGGLHIENGNVLKNLNLRDGGGNFHMKPNGVFILGQEGAGVVEADKFQDRDQAPVLATQSGPMLVINNELHPAFREGSENRYVRNGVGVDRNGMIHFVISNDRVNFYDFARLFRDRLHCPDALYLDGSISEFYLPELERFGTGQGFCGILAVVE